jgi:hypothetical protein
MIRPTFLFFALLAALKPVPATAQEGYMFKQPNATVSLRFGVGGPSANDELFNFFTRELTLDRKDFRAFAFGADIAVRATPRLDVVLGLGVESSSNQSEFRDWTDTDDLPIEQTTDFMRAPVTLGAKVYLVERGRSISRHAWVPVNFTPYLTAGGGYMAYRLEQDGDFVDYETLEIFSRTFETSGGGATAYAGAGGEWWLSPRIGLNADGRYAWASANLDRDFSDFGTIDLNGFQFTAGLAVRF